MSRCEHCIARQLNSMKALSKDELKRISECQTTKIIKQGDVVFGEGETLNGVFCIKDGICKLSKLSENGKDQIIKLVFKGDVLGQRSLLGNESANLNAIALNDMEVCFIPKEEIVGNLRKNPNFSMETLNQLAHDLRDADNSIVNMAQKSVRKRLAELLLYLYTNFGLDQDHYLNIQLSRDDYASAVGTAIESAIRILSKFKKEGLIATNGKKIKILDMDALKRIE